MNFENTYTKKEKKKNGIYYTPLDFCEFMVNKALKIDDGEGVWLDPCCGLGALSISLSSLQKDPISFIKNRLVINDTDKNQLDIALNNFKEKFGVVPKSFNQDFLTYDFKCDFIIMNPPYFKYKKNDMYSYFLEKACLNTKGFISINPLSYTNGVKFNTIRKKILNFKSVNLYHFDNIPGRVFDDASVRASIIIVSNITNERKTTGIIRWKTKNREDMLKNIDDNLDDAILTPDIFYKTYPSTSHLIHNDILSNYVVKKSNFPLYITNTPRYFITASTKKLNRSQQIEIFLKDEDTFNQALIMLNSSYLYWWWRVCDSSLSLTKKTLLTLPWIDIKYPTNIIGDIIFSEEKNKVYKKNAGKLQENIKHPKDLIQQLNSLFLDERFIKLHN